MSLLALEHVEKAYGSGPGRHVVLRDVSLEIEAGEMVAVWGLRRSGRSTLLRVAAGIEAPDAGSVRFEGHDLRGRGREALGEQIGYCRKTFRPSEGRLVIDHLIVGQLARGVPVARAATGARAALERTGAEQCAGRTPGELDWAECVRVSIARARVLVAIADAPGACNRKIADAAGVTDEGQISKLLSRLEDYELVRTSGSRPRWGPHEWHLTARGREVERAIRVDFAS